MERLYSRQAVRECLRARRRVMRRLLVAEGVKDAPIVREIADLARGSGLPVAQVQRDALDANAQGVALEVEGYVYADVDDILGLAGRRGEPPLVVMLDAIQDVHNLGALIRTAEAAGAHGIVISEHRGAAITPAVVNASSGAVEHMLVARVVNLAREVDALKAADVWVAALAGGAPRAQDLFSADLRGGLCLIVGSEGEGVSRLLRDKADLVLGLPMYGRVESLNASVAGGIALYEAVRQRRPHSAPLR